MNGTQYDYRINYSDVQSLFLLPKPDGTRMAFVISLSKPIRQGQQRYQHLVLETHKLDETVQVNLTDEEMASKYDNQLTKEMTMPLCNLIAKIFKVLTQSTVSIYIYKCTHIYCINYMFIIYIGIYSQDICFDQRKLLYQVCSKS